MSQWESNPGLPHQRHLSYPLRHTHGPSYAQLSGSKSGLTFSMTPMALHLGQSFLPLVLHLNFCAPGIPTKYIFSHFFFFSKCFNTLLFFPNEKSGENWDLGHQCCSVAPSGVGNSPERLGLSKLGPLSCGNVAPIGFNGGALWSNNFGLF